MICVIWLLVLTVSDVYLKLSCFQSTSTYSTLEVSLLRYINSRLTYILDSACVVRCTVIAPLYVLVQVWCRCAVAVIAPLCVLVHVWCLCAVTVIAPLCALVQIWCRCAVAVIPLCVLVQMFCRCAAIVTVLSYMVKLDWDVRPVAASHCSVLCVECQSEVCQHDSQCYLLLYLHAVQCLF